MNYNEYLHKFVNTHTENFLQSFNAIIESAHVECVECPVEKTNTDNFLIKVYINSILHNTRTLLMTCVHGTVGNLLHDTQVTRENLGRSIIMPMQDNIDDDFINVNETNINNSRNEETENTRINDPMNSNNNQKFNSFIMKCKKIHSLRKKLEDIHLGITE